jgi:hypothetical protein
MYGPFHVVFGSFLGVFMSMRVLASIVVMAAAVVAARGAGAQGAAATRPAASASAPASQPVDPKYLAWMSFKAGSSVTTKTVQEKDGKLDYTNERTETLKSMDDSKLALDFTSTNTKADGTKDPASKGTMTYNRIGGGGGERRPEIKYTEGDEEVDVGGKKIKTHWTQTEMSRPDGGGMTMKAWNSPEMPGGLVRSESTFKTVRDGVTSTQHQVVTVTAFEVKK